MFAYFRGVHTHNVGDLRSCVAEGRSKSNQNVALFYSSCPNHADTITHSEQSGCMLGLVQSEQVLVMSLSDSCCFVSGSLSVLTTDQLL